MLSGAALNAASFVEALGRVPRAVRNAYEDTGIPLGFLPDIQLKRISDFFEFPVEKPTPAGEQAWLDGYKVINCKDALFAGDSQHESSDRRRSLLGMASGEAAETISDVNKPRLDQV